MSISDYRANSNVAPGAQASAKALLGKPIGAVVITVSNIVRTTLLVNPAIYHWQLVRNFDFSGSDIDIYVDGELRANIAPGEQYFVTPLPLQSLEAEAIGAPNNRIYVTAY